ncbi:MAG: hypothetical protein LBB13_00555 [Rickettsiales bacterium]|jgi:hypothetical protein|nr:hypothetical protein [Rickettsiales bacterium]
MSEEQESSSSLDAFEPATSLGEDRAEEKGDSGEGKSKAVKGKKAKDSKNEADDPTKKELEEAKKASAYNASRYASAKANMLASQGRSLLMAVPFIILGIIVLFIMINKGGDWIQGGMRFVLTKAVGG